MDRATVECLKSIRRQMEKMFTKGIIPFWLSRGVDAEFGGYLTCFDGDGRLNAADTNKYIVTQTRMIWGFSLFHRFYRNGPNGHDGRGGRDRDRYAAAARQGVDFFIKYFWDERRGGWYWRVARDGKCLDDGKVVYGQSFAIYALSEYYLATGDPRGLEYAERTFDLLQRYCADTARGGYYENLEPDWTLSAGGFCAGDRKSLDIHMHLMECFTTLAEASGREIHRRRLQEVIDVILTRMINPQSGCGRNQFDLNFNPIPAIAIRRTFNAERDGESVATPADTTSYGHNVELAWLLVRAGEILGKPRDFYAPVARRLLDHSLASGVDWERGGVYRDGTHDGKVLVRDKEFWQNSEVMVGYLDAFEITRDPRYLKAFEAVWRFFDGHLFNHELGEIITLCDETNRPISRDLGTPWKACYHSGRSLHESLQRIDMILG